MASGRDILISLRRRWMLQGIVFCVLLSVAVSLVVWTILHSFLYGLGAFCLALPTALFLFPNWKITLAGTARTLDRYIPELEESSHLLLKPDNELGMLENLQVTRVEERLGQAKFPHPFRKRLILGGALVLISVGVWVMVAPGGDGRMVKTIEGGPVAAAFPLPPIETIDIKIFPPAYTGRTIRTQHDPNVQAEEGASIDVGIITRYSLDSVQLILSDSARIPMSASNYGHTVWHCAMVVAHSGFYQLRTNGKLSDMYRIEVVRDEAPRITIRTPKPYTILDIGESRKIPLIARVQDDYGVKDATIVATIATGSGEAVKFREQVLPFDAAFSGRQPLYDLRQNLNLDALGVHPGDELYFYCKARDNHGAETRSDMYIISLPDTSQLMSLSGLTMGVDIKPELFRSQRQIIIETEQLLRSKDTVSIKQFNDKSSDLGVDQKLLRLRYGKFLGEEAEEGGAGESFNKAGSSPADFSNAAKVLDAFTDKHDNAEDATYFEPAIKQQLKATLNEMWSAELRLRTLKPAEALPYEYKALRLLKDLQQKSRAFVAKTGVKVTPLDTAKRLKGTLDGIGQPVSSASVVREPSPEDKLRMALSILDRVDAPLRATERQPAALSIPAASILQEAGRQLGRQAADHPGEYLAGFQALKRLLSDTDTRNMSDIQPGAASRQAADAHLVQQALRRLVSLPEANPSMPHIPADEGLSQLYFNKAGKQ